MARFIRTCVKAAILLALAATIVFAISFLVHARKDRQEFEKCSAIHRQIVARLEGMRTFKVKSTQLDDDHLWDEGCETLVIIYSMTWGHFPAPLSEDAYSRLSEDLNQIIDSPLKNSEILEQAWTRIGQASPQFSAHLQEKEAPFMEILEDLKARENMIAEPPQI